MHRKIALIVVVTAAFVLTVMTTALCATPLVVLLTRSYQPKAILVADGPFADAEDFGRSAKFDPAPGKQDSASAACKADPKTGLTSCQDTLLKTWCDSKTGTLSPGFEGDNSDALAACKHAFGNPKDGAR
jgi:hypothetical protein